MGDEEEERLTSEGVQNPRRLSTLPAKGIGPWSLSAYNMCYLVYGPPRCRAYTVEALANAKPSFASGNGLLATLAGAGFSADLGRLVVIVGRDDTSFIRGRCVGLGTERILIWSAVGDASGLPLDSLSLDGLGVCLGVDCRHGLV